MSSKESIDERIAEAWAHRDRFTLIEAAALWAGETPPKNFIHEKDHPAYDETRKYTERFNNVDLFKVWLARLASAISSDELEAFVRDNYDYDINGEKNYYEDEPHPHETVIRKSNLMRWAENNSLFPPFLFSETVQSLQYSKIIPALIDKSHPAYIHQLAIIFKAWIHFYIDDNLEPGSDHALQVRAWIEKNFRFVDSEDPEFVLEILPKDTVKHMGSMANKSPYKLKKPKKIRRDNIEFKFHDEEET